MARKVKTVQVQTAPLRPDLQFDESSIPGFKEAAVAAQPNVEMEAMKAQIAEMKAALASQQSANIALMSQPSVSAPPQVRTSLDTKDLPDPTIEPEKYATEIARRGAELLDGQRQLDAYNARQHQSQTGRLNALWEDFNTKYPDYADNDERVKYAATSVVEQAAARGIDVNKYMFLHPDQFMKDVVSKMDTVFGKPEADDEADDIVEAPEENRTVGIFGGAESGGKPNAGKDAPVRAPSMFDDIRDWQAKTGFSR